MDVGAGGGGDGVCNAGARKVGIDGEADLKSLEGV